MQLNKTEKKNKQKKIFILPQNEIEKKKNKVIDFLSSIKHRLRKEPFFLSIRSKNFIYIF